jgi:hypothetical protein
MPILFLNIWNLVLSHVIKAPEKFLGGQVPVNQVMQAKVADITLPVPQAPPLPPTCLPS